MYELKMFVAGTDEVVAHRALLLPGDDLKAEEWRTGVVAKEMYRDAMYRAGKWPRR